MIGVEDDLGDLSALTPLLPDSEEIRLTEADIDPIDFPLWLVGRATEGLHAIKFTHGDLHGGNAMFDAKQIQVSFIDLAAAAQHNQLTPERAFVDIFVPFGSFPRESFIAFLSGYIRQQFVAQGERGEGFIESILRLVGGRVLDYPWRRNPAAFIAEFAQSLTIDGSGQRLRVRLADRSVFEFLEGEEFADVWLLLAVLKFCGAPASDIEAILKAIPPKRGDERNVAAAIFGKNDPRRLKGDSALATALKSIAAPDSPFAPSQDRLDALRGLHQNEALAAQREDIIDKFVFCMLLAAGKYSEGFSVETWRPRDDTSASLVQIADAHVQPTFGSSDGRRSRRKDEQRYVRLLSWKNDVPWYLQRSKVIERHAPVSLFTAMNSDAITDNRAFGVGSEALLWSAAVRARETYQDLVFGLSTLEPLLASGKKAPMDPEVLVQLAPALFGGYGATLRDMVMSSVSVPAFARAWLMEPEANDWDKKSKTVKDETLWAVEMLQLWRGEAPFAAKLARLHEVHSYTRRKRDR
jgi:hypothetical protein